MRAESLIWNKTKTLGSFKWLSCLFFCCSRGGLQGKKKVCGNGYWDGKRWNYQQAKLWGFFVDSAIDPAAGPEERGEDNDRGGELSQLEGFRGRVCDAQKRGFSDTLPRADCEIDAGYWRSVNCVPAGRDGVFCASREFVAAVVGWWWFEVEAKGDSSISFRLRRRGGGRKGLADVCAARRNRRGL